MVHRVLLYHSTHSIKSSWQCNSKPSFWSFLLLLYMFYLFYKTHSRMLIILLYRVNYFVAIKNKETIIYLHALFKWIIIYMYRSKFWSHIIFFLPKEYLLMFFSVSWQWDIVKNLFFSETFIFAFIVGKIFSLILGF